jgi:hypothetical protein
MAGWLLIPAIVTTVFWYTAKDSPLPGVWLICYVLFLILIWPLVVAEPAYRCRECSNTHFTHQNTLNYPENDRSCLDVPYDATVRIYVDDD